MASPDPVVVERQMYLDLLGIADDPTYSVGDLREMTAGGASVYQAAKNPKNNDLRYASIDTVPVNVGRYNVKPSNSAAVNNANIAAMVAAGITNFWFPISGAVYNISMNTATGAPLFNFVNQKNIKISGDNVTLNDVSVHTNNGALTPVVLLDNCKDFKIWGIEYVGPLLATPETLLGYMGAIVIRAINGTDGVEIDMRMTNCRYGLQTGAYDDGTKGQCRNFKVRIRGTKIGYPIAAYYADNIEHDIYVDGCHRAVYVAGCWNVRGVAMWRNQYIADTAYLITDCLTSGAGSDAAAQLDPVGSPTTSRGCTNVKVVSIDTGSDVFQSSSRCAGISLSRVDPCEYKDIDVKVYTKATATKSTQVGGWMVISGVKTVQTRYAFNYEPWVVLENIKVGGIVDHSASSGVGNSGSEFYCFGYDTTTGHALTVNNFSIEQFTFIPSTGNNRPSYFQMPGITSPVEFKQFRTPGVTLSLFTKNSISTIFRECVLASIDVAGTAGGSKVTLTDETVVNSILLNGVPDNNATVVNVLVDGGAAVGGASARIKQIDVTVPLTGASVTIPSAIKPGLLLGVSARIQSIITGATGYQVGITGDLTRFINTNDVNPGLARGPAAQAVNTNPLWYIGATDIIVTAKTSNFTGGSLRVVIQYIEITLPTA